eukprot:Skav220192  [mRNA]  locus=scaffold1074:268028:276474:- [translate_table: standard]
MAPVEFATIAENAHGSAFEVGSSNRVKIKRSGSTKMTAAQQRLESYATQPRPAKNTGTLRCEQLADKAGRAEVVNKLRMDRTQSADTKRIESWYTEVLYQDLVQHLEKAEELRKGRGVAVGTLSNRKERAAQHYEKDLPAAERLTDLSVRLYEHHMVAFPGGA